MTLPCLRILAVLCCLTASAQAQETVVNIMGGPKGSTAMEFANLLSDMSQQCGYETAAHETVGALENLLAIREQVNTQFGLVQSDVLEYLRAYEGEDPEIESAVTGLRVAFPLYDQEVHILARKDVAELPDLRGKKVSLGAPNSGDFLTATVIFDLLGYSPGERLTLAPKDALEALLSGQIDAMFFVDGAPSQLLSNAQIDSEKFHLVDITDPILEIAYTSGTIAADTYSFVKKETAVVTVKSVALTFDYVPEGRNEYNTLNCSRVADVTHLAKQYLTQNAKSGHPKWDSIDFGAEILDWNVSACAALGLSDTYQPTCR